MLERITGLAATFFVMTLLAACSSINQYEQQVEDFEPVYCYKSIGSVQCYKAPKPSDSRRLVNFYGPAPKTYDATDEPDHASAKASKMIDYWVKDPEPIPQASPPKDTRLNAETVSASPEMQAMQREDVSFVDVLMRSIFGKPDLANKPVAVVKTLAAAPVVKPLTSASPASR